MRRKKAAATPLLEKMCYLTCPALDLAEVNRRTAVSSRKALFHTSHHVNTVFTRGPETLSGCETAASVAGGFTTCNNKGCTF